MERKGIMLAGNMLTDTVKMIPAYPEKGMLVSINDIKRGVGGAVPNSGMDLAIMDGSIPVFAAGRVGEDDNGGYLIDRLNSVGIDTSAVKRDKTGTSFSDVMTVEGTGERTFFHYRGANAKFGIEDINVEKITAKIFHLGYLLLLDRLEEKDETYGNKAARLLAKVKETVEKFKYCVVVVGEGLKDKNGNELGADKNNLDAFGHPVLSGSAEALAKIVQGKLGTKTRTVKLGYAQRAASHFSSQTDVDEAFACGAAAVRAAVEGKSGFMVKIVRTGENPYTWTTDLHPLEEIANVEHFLPREWITEDGFLPNEKFINYARPLIEGEVQPPFEGGLPKYIKLEAVRVEKKLPPRA